MLKIESNSPLIAKDLFAVDYMKSAQNYRAVIELEQDRLFHELERLKQKLGLGHELELKWLLGKDKNLSGEVRGTCICIYEVSEEKALETLKHEFLDYVISKAIEPYERIANKLIQLTNEEAYKRKEKLTEALVKLI